MRGIGASVSTMLFYWGIIRFYIAAGQLVSPCHCMTTISFSSGPITANDALGRQLVRRVIGGGEIDRRTEHKFLARVGLRPPTRARPISKVRRRGTLLSRIPQTAFPVQYFPANRTLVKSECGEPTAHSMVMEATKMSRIKSTE